MKKFYKEKLVSKFNLLILTPVTFVFLFLAIFSELKILFSVMFVVFVFVTINFSVLKIRINENLLMVTFGIFKYKITLRNISSAEIDRTNAIRYGGWGIRFARIKNNYRIVFNTLGERRVLLSLKNKRFDEFAFSTKNPQAIIKIINN